MKKLATALVALSGCATSETDGAFHIEGRLTGTSNVTHVVAANPANATRVVANVHADGSFDIPVAPGAQWVITFADWKRVGKDMQVATLQEHGLDAFAPQTAGTLDLGTVKVTAGRAHGSVAWTDVVAALGIDDAKATRLGRMDNLALRYANPDIDNDGTIDAFQHGHTFQLDIDGSLTLTNDGKDVTFADLLNGHARPGVRYIDTMIRAVVPRTMGMNMASGTLTFEQPFYGSALGPSTPTVAPGKPVGAPHVKVGARDGQPMLGLVARGGADVPSGAYEVAFDNGRLTFSDVFAPPASSLDSATDYAVPFARIRATDERCRAECDIASIDLDWHRMTVDGWQPSEAQPARIDLAVRLNGKPVYLAADMTGASLQWADMPLTGTGLLASELAHIQSSEICFFRVTYATELDMGMRMSVANPACY